MRWGAAFDCTVPLTMSVTAMRQAVRRAGFCVPVAGNGAGWCGTCLPTTSWLRSSKPWRTDAAHWHHLPSAMRRSWVQSATPCPSAAVGFSTRWSRMDGCKATATLRRSNPSWWPCPLGARQAARGTRLGCVCARGRASARAGARFGPPHGVVGKRGQPCIFGADASDMMRGARAKSPSSAQQRNHSNLRRRDPWRTLPSILTR